MGHCPYITGPSSVGRTVDGLVKNKAALVGQCMWRMTGSLWTCIERAATASTAFSFPECHCYIAYMALVV